MGNQCVFCNPKESDIVLDNETGYLKWDKHPVTPGHILIIPFRHIPTYFDAGIHEKQSLWALVDDAKSFIEKEFLTPPDGYNIGINCGEAAEQSIPHLHIHLIPRFKGDVKKWEGGVRKVIPGKGAYK